MTITIDTASVDDAGRLVHADDATAQACLAVVRLEHELVRRGLSHRQVLGIHVLTTVGAPQDLLEVVRERLDNVRIPVRVAAVDRIAPPGALVRLRAAVAVTHPHDPNHTGDTTMSVDTAPSLAEDLRALPGVLLPGDPGFDEAAMAWNLAARLRPAAVATPRSVADVVAVVRAAVRAGLRICPMSTGHGALTLRGVPLHDTVLLRMSGLQGVTVDPVLRTARVVGGTQWRDVIEAAAAHGLTGLHGSAGDVAVAGYVLGGGLSFYGRAFGLAADSVRAIEIVTATGDLVRASTDDHADLFWALRGGTGGFGVVVAIEIDLMPISDVVAGMLVWDLAQAPRVLSAWADWTAHVPETVTSSLRFMRFPPLPELPDFLRGRSLVVVDGAILEDDERSADLLTPLRDLAPQIDTFARVPATAVLGMHMDPDSPMPAVSDHVMLTGLPRDAQEALISAVGPDAATSLMVAELRQLGGALGRPTDAALPMLDGAYSLFALTAVPTADAAIVAELATAEVVDALRPWGSHQTYSNFTERRSSASAFFDDATRRRLARIRAAYDPGRTWIAAHDD